MKYIHILIASCMLMFYSDHEPTYHSHGNDITNSTSYCLPYRCLTPPHLIILTADNNDNINDYRDHSNGDSCVTCNHYVTAADATYKIRLSTNGNDVATTTTSTTSQLFTFKSYQRHPPTHTPHLDHIVTPITSSPLTNSHSELLNFITQLMWFVRNIVLYS